MSDSLRRSKAVQDFGEWTRETAHFTPLLSVAYDFVRL